MKCFCKQITSSSCLTLSQTTKFGLIQTERVCRRQFTFYENGRKFSKMVENAVGKGEIARYEQFLLSPQCFPKTFNADTLKPGLVWGRVKKFQGERLLSIQLPHTIPHYDELKIGSCGKYCEKKRNRL